MNVKVKLRTINERELPEEFEREIRIKTENAKNQKEDIEGSTSVLVHIKRNK